MAKRVRVCITARGEEGGLEIGCTVSEKSKLSLADWIWFVRDKYKQEFKAFPKKIKVDYL